MYEGGFMLVSIVVRCLFICCFPLLREYSSASGRTMIEALHCITKCIYCCYTADEHQRSMTVQGIQEHDNGVKTLQTLDAWWLFAVFEFTFGCAVYT